MSSNLTDIKARLAYLDARVAAWREEDNRELSQEELDSLFDVAEDVVEDTEEVEPHEPGERPVEAASPVEAEAYSFFDELCDLYLETTPEQRAEIRNMIGTHRSMLDELSEYRWHAIGKFESTRGPEWVERALASVSIEDMRVDYRDNLVDMGELFIQAHNAGLDAPALFERVASISNAEETDQGGSTDRFIAEFRQGNYFRGNVKPKLKR